MTAITRPESGVTDDTPPPAADDGAAGEAPADIVDAAAAETAVAVIPRQRASWPRRTVWASIITIAAMLLTATWSYARALSAPGTDSLQARTVEWLRDRGMGTQVNAFENWYYEHHAPPKGGVPKGGVLPTLPQTATSAPAKATAPNPTLPGTSGLSSAIRAPVVDFVPAPPPMVPPPPNITPFASPALPDEGVWKPTGRALRGDPVLWTAFLRPDPIHTSLVTGVARMDTSRLKAVMYQGTEEPGHGPWTNTGPLPVDQRPNLVAAFNSGFRLQHARGGYFAEGRTVAPLVDGGASLVIDKTGKAMVGMWGRDYTLTPDVVAVRQNLSLIVDHGAPVDGLEHDVLNQWGFTVKNELLVWRSGVGMTADGALLYAAGPGLSVKSLADVLVAAGAVRAMEMDINPDWTNFFVYNGTDQSRPQEVDSTKLLPTMQPSADRYFKESSRDFIAVYLR